MIRVFPYRCKRETTAFMYQHIWSIIYLPAENAKMQKIVPVEDSGVEWACVGCVEDACTLRQQESCF